MHVRNSFRQLYRIHHNDVGYITFLYVISSIMAKEKTSNSDKPASRYAVWCSTFVPIIISLVLPVAFGILVLDANQSLYSTLGCQTQDPVNPADCAVTLTVASVPKTLADRENLQSALNAIGWLALFGAGALFLHSFVFIAWDYPDTGKIEKEDQDEDDKGRYWGKFEKYVWIRAVLGAVFGGLYAVAYIWYLARNDDLNYYATTRTQNDTIWRIGLAGLVIAGFQYIIALIADFSGVLGNWEIGMAQKTVKQEAKTIRSGKTKKSRGKTSHRKKTEKEAESDDSDADSDDSDIEDAGAPLMSRPARKRATVRSARAFTKPDPIAHAGYDMPDSQV